MMPLSTQSKGTNLSSDLFFSQDHEFMELLWENGQIIMQAQSNRPRKNPSCIDPSSQISEILEKDNDDSINPKVGCVPSAHAGIVQEEDIAPWLNYPVDDPLPNDYCSDFLPEITRFNLDPLSYQSINDPIERNSMFYQGSKDFCANENINPGDSNVMGCVFEEFNKTKNGKCLMFQRSQDVESYLKSGPVDPISDNNVTPRQTSQGYLNQLVIPTPVMYNDSVQKHDLLSSHKTPQGSNANVVNFSHFSRSSSHFRVNSHGSNAIKTGPHLGNSNVQDKLHVAEFQGKQDSLTSEPDGKHPNQCHIEQVCINQSKEISREKNSRSCTSPGHALCQSLRFAASTSIEKLDTENTIELGVVSSSVCSGSTSGGLIKLSNGVTKRKGQEVEEWESHSEDVEEELVDIRKKIYMRGSGAKRSRAAEVHNLSERRRRDRINEKMRALQELIPNCNKADKASMLDEAIEYLKSLQKQVQIMSMATGFCMPPMMLPAGMQPMPGPPMAPLPSINVGMNMGMGVGYSMGMLDMSGSTACSMISGGHPRPPCPPLSATTTLHGMPQVGLPMFGMPGQALPISVPHMPFISMPGFSPSPLLVTSAPLSNFKEKLLSQASDERLAQPTLMQRDSQVSYVDYENATISGRKDSNVASSGS